KNSEEEGLAVAGCKGQPPAKAAARKGQPPAASPQEVAHGVPIRGDGAGRNAQQRRLRRGSDGDAGG
ncbi:hypothetical protein GW17_00011010, partial [Ensete ventricosum]